MKKFQFNYFFSIFQDISRPSTQKISDKRRKPANSVSALNSLTESDHDDDANASLQISFENEVSNAQKSTEKDTNTTRQQRHAPTEWKYFKTFTSFEVFETFRKELKMSIDGISKSDTAERRYFRCSLVKRNGPHRMMVVEDASNTDFVVYVSTADHTHSQIANKMYPELRERIIKLNNTNMDFTAQKIRDIFVDEELPFIPKLQQIQSIISYHCGSKTSNNIITNGDVVAWAKEHKSYENIDIDCPFVIDFKASEYDDTDKHFQYVISTKRLLQNASSYTNICVDATYEVNFFGYPLMVIGSVDANRKFHLIGASLCVSENTTDYTFLFQGMFEMFFWNFFFKLFIIIYVDCFYFSCQKGCPINSWITIQTKIVNL